GGRSPLTLSPGGERRTRTGSTWPAREIASTGPPPRDSDLRRLLALGALLLVVACRQKMAEQPRCEPLRASRMFSDGKCARELPAGTVPRGGAADRFAVFDPNSDRLPVGVTRELLGRGHERFDIYCATCSDPMD